MLYLDFNLPQDKVLLSPKAVFDAYMEPGWFDDPEVVRIAESIDKVKYEYSDAFLHPVLGRFSANKLSGGAKTVILVYKNVTLGKAIPLDWLSENCFHVLGSLEIRHDVVFYANSMPHLFDFECVFTSMHSGRQISTHEQYIEEFFKYACKDIST